MDVETGKKVYGGVWYQTENGGVHPCMDPAIPEANKLFERIRPHLEREITQDIRVLEIGCGAGRYSFAMEKMGASVTGIDCCEYPLNYARKLADQWQSSCNFIQGDQQSMSFEDESFDLVLFPMNIVESTYEEMENIIDEVYRILAVGGKFCVEMQDWLERSIGRGEIPKGYDMLSGTINGLFQAPGYEAIPTKDSFWTVGFATHLIGKKFNLIHQDKTAKERFWLVFQKAD